MSVSSGYAQSIDVSFVSPLTTGLVDSSFFIANRAYQVVDIRQIHATAAGATANVQVTKDTSTNAPGAGVDLLLNNTNAGFNLNATANTVQTGSLTGTAADLVLAAGDRLSVDFSGTIGSTAGVTITVSLIPA